MNEFIVGVFYLVLIALGAALVVELFYGAVCSIGRWIALKVEILTGERVR